MFFAAQLCGIKNAAINKENEAVKALQEM